MYFDLSLEELQRYQPLGQKPADFDGFWDATLAKARAFDLHVEVEKIDYGMDLLEIYNVTFNGYGGQPVYGWFMRPKQENKQIPCVVQYVGYGGGRGLPYEWLLFPCAGYATFVMDTRGQGSAWSSGSTADIPSDGTSPHYPGFMTQGILSPETYYYRRVFTDAVRAVDAAKQLPGVDSDRIAITGRSQGGGISLAVAGLLPGLCAVMPDVPFLCNFRRAVSMTDEMPYAEIARFCKVHRDQVDQVFRTLSYFDGMYFATRAAAPALFSAGLMDTICPPSTVFSAFNWYQGSKRIETYEFNQHDGGGPHHTAKQLDFLKKIWD